MTVDHQLISSIGKGVLVFAAVGPDDTRKDAESMASKVLKMKMWPDEAGVNVRAASLSVLATLTARLPSGNKACKISRAKSCVVCHTYPPLLGACIPNWRVQSHNLRY